MLIIHLLLRANISKVSISISTFLTLIKKMKPKIFFSNGIPHGPATLYLTNGDTEERTYESGQLHGIATFVSHTGDKEERCYRSGKLDGTAKYYYTSGAVESRIYENGILQGMRRLELHRYFIIRYQLLEFC